MLSGTNVYTRSHVFFEGFRALVGIGPAMMPPSALAILRSMCSPGRRKEIVFLFFAAVAPNGFVTGAVFGAFLAQLAW